MSGIGGVLLLLITMVGCAPEARVTIRASNGGLAIAPEGMTVAVLPVLAPQVRASRNMDAQDGVGVVAFPVLMREAMLHDDWSMQVAIALALAAEERGIACRKHWNLDEHNASTAPVKHPSAGLADGWNWAERGLVVVGAGDFGFHRTSRAVLEAKGAPELVRFCAGVCVREAIVYVAHTEVRMPEGHVSSEQVPDWPTHEWLERVRHRLHASQVAGQLACHTIAVVPVACEKDACVVRMDMLDPQGVAMRSIFAECVGEFGPQQARRCLQALMTGDLPLPIR